MQSIKTRSDISATKLLAHKLITTALSASIFMKAFLTVTTHQNYKLRLYARAQQLQYPMKYWETEAGREIFVLTENITLFQKTRKMA